MLLLLSFFLSVIGLFFFLGDPLWFPSFYHPKIMGVVSFIFIFLLSLPRLLFRGAESPERKKAVSRLERAIAFSLLLSASGTLGLYQFYRYGFEYDKLVHFLFSFIMTFALADFVSAWYGVRPARAIFGVGVLIMVGGIIWELIEIFSQTIFGVSLVTIFDASLTRDTILDLVLDFLGIIFGWILFRRKRY